MDRPVKTYSGGVPHYVDTVDSLRKELKEAKENAEFHFANYEAMQQQLTEAAKTCAEMLSEQDYEYNRKTNAIIERHAKQLAERQAREKVLRDALDKAIELLPCGPQEILEARHLQSDSTALDAMLKQAKREALAWASEELRSRYDIDASREIAILAKELE
jgi:septal ring factor EnvC (AmiA/AmiB activator)